MTRLSVIGRACRLPGVDNVEEFWDLLDAGRCTVTRVPEERFSQSWYLNPRRGESGKAYTFAAGVLEDIWGFDPSVFSITPREARQMDPQQRILLQLVWEALEDAGVPASDISGKRIGVYVGASSMDYSHRQFFDPAGTDSYLMTGNTLSLISNRVSYIFDLQGPSLTIDTACSSSLVALDYAAQDLRAGRVDAAIVGGVNALLSPFNFMGFCAASMLSPDGLCRPFDHRGNGYVRAEGGVVMLLQRDDQPGLQSTKYYGDVIASGMNSDGRTSGVALPSSEQQGALLHSLYEQSAIDPNHLAFVEAHGTGTMVGDPAEAGALGRMLGVHRSAPLPIGSAKSNVGHLEPASGIVGLLKAQLALEHGRLPRSLHVEELNPHIPFDELNLEVAVDPIELKDDGDQPMMAGVNNFGFGGTNVHVVIAAADKSRQQSEQKTADPIRLEMARRDRPAENVFMISANCKDALVAQAGRYVELLQGVAADATQFDCEDVAVAAAHRRDRLPHRLIVTAHSEQELIDRLKTFVAGEEDPHAVEGRAVGRKAKTALVFSGNGAQWDGMGRVAFESSTSFRRHFRAVDQLYNSLVGVSLEELLFAEDLGDQLKHTEIAQPLLFAVQVALARSLQDQGLVFGATVGHSVGEVAAAHIAGALDLSQAVGVIRARSKHQELAAGKGLMAAVQASRAMVADLLEASDLRTVEIAAHNSPRSVTVSGSPEDIQAFAELAEQNSIAARVLEINYPFHSARLDVVREPLLETLSGLSSAATNLEFFSTVTGELNDGVSLDSSYWWDNVRKPVRFDEAVSACATAGYQVFVEIGPHSILRKYIADNVADTDLETKVITTLEQSDHADRAPVRATLARTIAAGAEFDADVVFGPDNGKPVPLPHYAWQNKDYLFAMSNEALETFNTQKLPHPLLGLQLRSEDYVWDNHIDTGLVPYLADHQVGGKPIMPGTGFVEMALNAAALYLGTKELELRDLDFIQALELHSDECQKVRTRVYGESNTIDVASRPRLTDDQYQTHVKTRYAKIPSERVPDVEAPDLTTANDGPILDGIYRLAEKFGLDYGPAFQRVTACREIGDEIIEVELSPPQDDGSFVGSDGDYIIHPVDFDACFHGLNVVYERLVFGETKLAYVPVHLGRLRVFAPGQRIRTARIRLNSYNTRAVRAGFELFGADGTLVAIADNVRFRASSLVHRVGLAGAAYHIDHIVRPLPGTAEQSAALALSALVSQLRDSAGSGSDASQFEENRLLLDMAARRGAFDVVAKFADRNGVVDLAPSRGDLSDRGSDNDNVDGDGIEPGWHYRSQDCATVMTSLVSLLASSELVRSLDNNLRWKLVGDADCPLPPLDEIVATVLQEDPAWSAECTLLLRAVDHLSSWLAAPSFDDRSIDPEIETSDEDAETSAVPTASEVFTSSALEHFFCASPMAQSQINRVVETLSTLRDAWPNGRPLRVLQLGIAGGGLTRAMLPVIAPRSDELTRATLVVADTDESWVARLANLHTRTPGFEAVHITGSLDELAPHGRFDVVVSSNGLHQLHNCGGVLASLRGHVATDAVCIISETEPTAFHDVVFAGTRGWFDTALVDGVAFGRLRNAESWAEALSPAGFVEAGKPGEASGSRDVPGTSFVVAQKSAASMSADQDADAASETTVVRQVLLIAAETSGATFVTNLQSQLSGVGATAAISPGTLAAMLKNVAGLSDEMDADKGQLKDKAQCAATLEPLFADKSIVPDIVYVSPACVDANDEAVLLDQTSQLTALLSAIGDREARLWIIAEGGARAIAGLGDPSPVQSGIWGFGRTVLNEYAHLDVRLVDIAGDIPLDDAASAVQAVMIDPGDLKEFVISRDALHGLQVRRGPPAMERTATHADTTAKEGAATVLELAQTGDLDGLTWVGRERKEPAADEVEIEVAATGLNFRDVMWSLGLLPEEALEDGFAGPTVGFECSGRIVRVGRDVADLQPGDPVIAMAPACFASHVTVTTDAVAKLPENVALDDAASIPVAFLTAYYALDYLARLRKDEWVLIHGAAGGVGLAAVQIAKRAGARIIATAGTDEKRAILTTLGADHVLDTRSLEFVDDVKSITGGGVDVLLNSLAGEAMERSIDLMRPFGRFLELGKRDFYSNTKVGLRPFRRNVSYFGIDADQLLTYRPDVVRTVFREVIDGFADGTFTPLPHRVFSEREVVDAFRLMQKSGHIGKILVKAPPADSGVEVSDREFLASPDGTHILVGGTGGFGLEMVRWLADRGARHILLTSRSGGGGETLEQLTKDLSKRNVSLKVAQCDATDAAALETLLNAERSKRPIAGVAHTAMVLDDGLISNLTPDRIQKVLAPKVTGAHHLDRLTRDDALDYFVLFSSAAAMFGNPGQGNYTAANGYLDGLAHARAARGLKAISVAWGAISDVGVLTRQKDTAESLARHTGGIEFRARDGLNLLARILVRDDCDSACTNIALATMNWSMAGEMLGIMQTPAYALIQREAKSGAADHGEQIDIRAAINGLDDNAARGVLADYLAREVANIFRMPVEDISLKRSLADIGMDSLMGLELRMAAQRGLGIDIPIVSISDGTTINDIAARVLTRLRGGDEDGEGTDVSRSAMIDQHVAEDLDEADLDRLEKRIKEHEAGLQKVV